MIYTQSSVKNLAPFDIISVSMPFDFSPSMMQECRALVRFCDNDFNRICGSAENIADFRKSFYGVRMLIGKPFPQTKMKTMPAGKRHSILLCHLDERIVVTGPTDKSHT